MSFVHFGVQNTSLNYVSGTQQLQTTPGSVRFIDNGSSFDKDIYRDLAAPPTPGAESWFSMLVRYESTGTWNSTADFSLIQGIGQTPSQGRDIGLGINDSGELRLFTSGAGTIDQVVSTLAPNVDHLLLVQMEDRPFGPSNTTDRINVWLDPDLAAPGAPDASATGTHVYVGNNASYTFDRFEVFTDITQNGIDQFFFDEIRLGTTLADVLPAASVAAIPEPSSALLAATLLLGICGYSRHQKRAKAS